MYHHRLRTGAPHGIGKDAFGHPLLPVGRTSGQCVNGHFPAVPRSGKTPELTPRGEAPPCWRGPSGGNPDRRRKTKQIKNPVGKADMFPLNRAQKRKSGPPMAGHSINCDPFDVLSCWFAWVWLMPWFFSSSQLMYLDFLVPGIISPFTLSLFS